MMRVLLVDDQDMIRAGLRALIADAGIELAGEASDGKQAILAVSRLRPDAVLMDLRMPVMDGISAIRAIRAIRADSDLARTPILVLTTFDGDRGVVDALQAGADGFLSKAAAPEQLVAALIDVAEGRTAISDRAARSVLRHLSASRAKQPEPQLVARVAELTTREREIVIAAARGLDNQQIAQTLLISPVTVKTHLNRAMAKLDARERGQLVSIAFRAGIVD